MRTRSGSMRWLVCLEVPVRLASRSGCRSCSLSSSPGGQPSTMAPSAGPWLSPKVVTLNSVPMVLPDMPAFLQLARVQQEYAAAALLEFEPREWQRRPFPPDRPFGVTRLDDEDPMRLQMPARPGQNALDDRQPAARCLQAEPGFRAVLRRQAPHPGRRNIRRVTDDDIVATPAQGAVDVGSPHSYAPAQATPPHIA